MKFIFASNNAHKIEELQHIFTQLQIPISIISQKEFLGEKNIDVEENGKTLEENARIKAETLFALTGMPVIADDTGLEVVSLQNAPGVLSARYAGEHGNDKANREKLLSVLGNENNRAARFRTVLYFKDSLDEFFVEGLCEGTIAYHEHGDKGFGYDSLFIPNGYTETFAQMNIEEKNIISHRAKASFALAKTLSSLIASRNINE